MIWDQKKNIENKLQYKHMLLYKLPTDFRRTSKVAHGMIIVG